MMAGKKGMKSGVPGNQYAVKVDHVSGKTVALYIKGETYLALKARYGDNTDKVIRQVALEVVEGLKEGGQDGK